MTLDLTHLSATARLQAFESSEVRVRLVQEARCRFDRLMVSQRSVPQRALNLGSQNSHNPLSAMDLREILWDFHVVCLNAPKIEIMPV